MALQITFSGTSQFTNRRRQGNADRLKDLATGAQTFAADCQAFVPIFYEGFLESFQVLLDVGPFKAVAGLCQAATELFSEHQGQEAIKHRASDGLIALVKHRPGLENTLDLLEDLLYLPELFVLQRHLLGGKVGVGGHSYGAFMTANLLAHCDLFAAGIARSGAYNRTLTPFGFQSERRTLWQAPDAYFKVSTFMHAHKINEPILLIHGEVDNNSGTFPIQSQRMYHALKGHGAITKLVMLPYESHSYKARESVLHVLAEMFDWFNKYVKN